MADGRAAVRIICIDGEGRVLLLRWRDPYNGRLFWEPPGGGVEGAETPLEAARRELTEETGLPGAAVLDVSVPVERDSWWNGRRHQKIEPFFLARFEGTPEVASAAFTESEIATYAGHGWFAAAALAALDDLEPPDLGDALARLKAADRPGDRGGP